MKNTNKKSNENKNSEKSKLQVPDTGTRVLGNTRLFWCSSIICFWMPPACSKERKYHIFGQYWYTRNVPVFTNTGTFQYLGPEVYFFQKLKMKSAYCILHLILKLPGGMRHTFILFGHIFIDPTGIYVTYVCIWLICYRIFIAALTIVTTLYITFGVCGYTVSCHFYLLFYWKLSFSTCFSCGNVQESWHIDPCAIVIMPKRMELEWTFSSSTRMRNQKLPFWLSTFLVLTREKKKKKNKNKRKRSWTVTYRHLGTLLYFHLHTFLMGEILYKPNIYILTMILAIV